MDSKEQEKRVEGERNKREGGCKTLKWSDMKHKGKRG